MTTSNLKHWLSRGELDKLENVVLEGRGIRLLGEQSPDLRTRVFLKGLPNYLTKISQIHDAVVRGSLPEVQRLVEGEPKKKLTVAKDSAGTPLIHKAVYYDHQNVVEWIVDNYPTTVEQKDKEGRTALHYCAACGDPEAVWDILIEAGCDASVCDKKGNPAAYYLQRGAEIELPDPENMPGHRSRRRNANQDKWQANCLDFKPSNIRIWIHNRDIGKLQQVLWEGHGAKLRCETSNNVRVKRFLEAVPFIMVTVKDIHAAVIKNDIDTFRKKVEEPVSPIILSSKDGNGLNVLHKAAGLGYIEMAKEILEKYPAIVSAQDSDGRTPLHYAAGCRDGGVMYDLLVEYGSDESRLDNRGKAAAFYKNRPMDIDLTNLVTVPDAPRVSGANYPRHWDWRIIDSDQPLPRIKRTGNNADDDSAFGSAESAKLTEDIATPEIENAEDEMNGNEEENAAEDEPEANEAEAEAEAEPVADENDNPEENEEEVEPADEEGEPDDNNNNEVAEVKAEAEPEAEPEVKTEAETETEGVIKADAGPSIEAEAKAEAETVTAVRTEAHFEADVAAVVDADADTEVVTDDEADVEADTEVSEAAIEAMTEATVECAVESALESEGEADTEVTTELDAQAETAVEIEPKVSVKAKVVSEGDANKEVEAEGEAEAETEAEDEIEVEAEVEVEAGVEGGEEVDAPADAEEVNETQEGEEEEAKEEEEEVEAPAAEEADADKETGEAEVPAEDIEEPEPEADTEETDEKAEPSTADSGLVRTPNDEEQAVAEADEDEEEGEEEEEEEEEQASPAEEETKDEEEQREQEEEEEDGNEETATAEATATDDDDEETAELMENGTMEQLAAVVLSGEGHRLLNRQSGNPELQAFIDNVPAYMAKIRTVHNAVKEGNLKELKITLDRRKFAMAKDQSSPHGATPLHVAVIFGHTAIVRYLARKFPETTHALDLDGRTPLHYAATLADNGHYYNVLLHLGANPLVQDNFGQKAEYYKHNQDDLSHKQLLRDFGAPESIADDMLVDKDLTIFHDEEGRYLASSLGDPLIKGLTEVATTRPKDPVTYLATYLYNFANQDKPKESEDSNILIIPEEQNGDDENQEENRDNENDDGYPQSPDLDAPESLFAETERDENGQSSLHYAANRSHSKDGLYHHLQETQMNIALRDSRYRTGRDVAEASGNAENVQEIDRFVVYLAARGETDKLVELLMEGYDHILDTEDDNKNILEIAEEEDNAPTVEFLKSIENYTDLRDEIHRGVRAGNLLKVRELLEMNGKGAKLLALGKNSMGRCSLHIAVLREHEDIVRYLAKTYPETLRTGDNLERTALHYAMGVPSVELMSSVLIKAGAKRVQKDLKSRQPSYYFMNRTDIEKLQQEEELLDN